MQKSNFSDRAAWYDGVFPLALSGVVLYLLALPPLGLWPLGWLVAACWTPLLRRETLKIEQKGGQKAPQNGEQKPKRKRTLFRSHPYRQIWLAGVIFWGVAVHWVCFPHWAAAFGCFAMSCYLGLYLPMFVFFARMLHHTPICGKLRLPLCLAAPTAWLAAVWLQKTLMGGFGFALLEHTQVRQTSLIQIADIGGESLVGAVMIFVGVLLGGCLPVRANGENLSKKRILGRFGGIFVTFIVLICYAKIRDGQCQTPDRPPLNVALLQGNYPASVSAPAEWYVENFEDFTKMAFEAASDKNYDTDLIIWPESTCVYQWLDIDASELKASTQKNLPKSGINIFLSEENPKILELSHLIDKPCIYGTGSYVYAEKKDRYFNYNSALFIEKVDFLGYDSGGQRLISPVAYARYDKILLVMFGEYIPFAEYLPDGFFLKTLCQRADFGKQPVPFVLHKACGDTPDNRIAYVASTNICFESSSSRVVRRQVLQLKEQGHNTDFLINISNDGWFHHSSQIDMHLATHVFRAVENRKPCLAATNGGFSVGVDGSGRVLAVGKRNTSQVVRVAMSPDGRTSCYHRLGDMFHFLSMGLVGIVCIRFFSSRRREDTRRNSKEGLAEQVQRQRTRKKE